MKEAMFFNKLERQRVKCFLCAHRCIIPESKRGICGVRENRGGELYSLVYGKIISMNVDPIEKKPLFHFHPASTSFSIATVGCNFKCAHCQNYDISQYPKDSDKLKVKSDTPSLTLPPRGGGQGLPASGGAEGDQGWGGDSELPGLAQRSGAGRTPYLPTHLAAQRAGQAGAELIPGDNVTPEQIVDAAERAGCKSISYTYTEPTIFFEFAYDCARLARKRGIKNVFVSNGYTGPEATKMIAPFLDGNNIDLKGDDNFYKKICGAKLQPVLDTIKLMKTLGVWVEITTLIIPSYNDSESALKWIAEFIKSVDPTIPWHVTQFYPTYKLTGVPRTPLNVLRRAREIGLETGLKYVYEGNVPGEGGENTYCPNCKELLIERFGFYIKKNKMIDAQCFKCKTKIDGVF